jgi:hypothetical protein
MQDRLASLRTQYIGILRYIFVVFILPSFQYFTIRIVCLIKMSVEYVRSYFLTLRYIVQHYKRL